MIPRRATGRFPLEAYFNLQLAALRCSNPPKGHRTIPIRSGRLLSLYYYCSNPPKGHIRPSRSKNHFHVARDVAPLKVRPAAPFKAAEQGDAPVSAGRMQPFQGWNLDCPHTQGRRSATLGFGM